MTPLECLTAKAVPLLRDNVDTDAIIPSREMKTVSKTGLADGLFAGWRYVSGTARELNPRFVLNEPRFQGSQILVSGENFGCGSSREHAVWALGEYGFRVVIARSFSPIFRANCIRNGIAPVVLPAGQISAVVAMAEEAHPITVDLRSMKVVCGVERFAFQLENEARMMLMEGLDGIELTMKQRFEIMRFREMDEAKRPWVYLSAP